MAPKDNVVLIKAVRLINQFRLYLANIVSGLLIFIAIMFIFSILKRVIHPFDKVNNLLGKYGKEDGIQAKELSKYYQMFKDKKYCLLIYLKDAMKIKPFSINKRGFGAMAAWISVEDVNSIKV